MWCSGRYDAIFRTPVYPGGGLIFPTWRTGSHPGTFSPISDCADPEMPEALLNYESLFQQMSVPFAVLDHDRRYVAVNTCYTEMLMRSAQDLIGNNIFDLFPETLERRRRVDAAFRKALAGQPITLSEVSYPIPGLTVDADTRNA